MTPNDVIKYFNGQTAAARALGCAQSSVAGWAAKGKVPMERQYQIEIATGGALKAALPALRKPTAQPCSCLQAADG